VSRLTLSLNVLCRQPARIRRENYGEIVLECLVHRFNDERFQALAYVGCSHRSDIILMICDDGLNRGDFLLGCHANTFNFLFGVGNQKGNAT
jgi:hypothetical protein